MKAGVGKLGRALLLNCRSCSCPASPCSHGNK